MKRYQIAGGVVVILILIAIGYLLYLLTTQTSVVEEGTTTPDYIIGTHLEMGEGNSTWYITDILHNNAEVKSAGNLSQYTYTLKFETPGRVYYPPVTYRNRTKHGANYTISIEQVYQSGNLTSILTDDNTFLRFEDRDNDGNLSVGDAFFLNESARYTISLEHKTLNILFTAQTQTGQRWIDFKVEITTDAFILNITSIHFMYNFTPALGDYTVYIIENAPVGHKNIKFTAPLLNLTGSSSPVIFIDNGDGVLSRGDSIRIEGKLMPLDSYTYFTLTKGRREGLRYVVGRPIV